MTDTALFRRSLSQIETDREEIVRNIAALERRQDVPRHLLTEDNMARFAAAARERLRSEDPTLRKGYVRQFVDRIEVDDHEIRIIGPTANLTRGRAGLRTRYARPECPVLARVGGRSRTRTCDPLIKSQLLYQLSYAPPDGEAVLYKGGRACRDWRGFRPIGLAEAADADVAVDIDAHQQAQCRTSPSAWRCRHRRSAASGTPTTGMRPITMAMLMKT